MIKQLRWVFPVLGFITILGSCVFEDEASPRPPETFVKYYGSTGNQHLKDMIVNSSENVVLLGDQAKAGQNQNTYIIETDSLGNEIQSIVFDVGEFILGDSSYVTEEVAESIKEIDDGYLVVGSFAELISGQTQQFAIYWVHFDDNLEVVKFDTVRAGPYSSTGATADNVYGSDITQTADGNIVIVGRTTLPEANDLTRNPGDQYFLIKEDYAADTTLFRKSYGYRNSDDNAIAVFELDDGNLALIGSTEQIGNGGGTGLNVGIMVLNPLATSQVTAKVFGVSIDGVNSSMDQPNDVIKVSGGFTVVGTSTLGQAQFPFLMGLYENSGSLIFSRALESKWGIDAAGNSVTVTREGDLAVVGSYPNYIVLDDDIDVNAQRKNQEVMFMRTGSSGFEKQEFEGNFGLVSGNDEGVVTCTLSSGSIMVGATIDFGSTQTMISLMKLNDRGVIQRQ